MSSGTKELGQFVDGLALPSTDDETALRKEAWHRVEKFMASRNYEPFESNMASGEGCHKRRPWGKEAKNDGLFLRAQDAVGYEEKVLRGSDQCFNEAIHRPLLHRYHQDHSGVVVIMVAQTDWQSKVQPAMLGEWSRLVERLWNAHRIWLSIHSGATVVSPGSSGPDPSPTGKRSPAPAALVADLATSLPGDAMRCKDEFRAAVRAAAGEYADGSGYGLRWLSKRHATLTGPDGPLALCTGWEDGPGGGVGELGEAVGTACLACWRDRTIGAAVILGARYLGKRGKDEMSGFLSRLESENIHIRMV